MKVTTTTRDPRHRPPRHRKSRPVLLVLIIVFIGTFVAAPLGVASLNFTGLCLREGRFLTDEEKVQVAVSYIMADYPPVLAQTRSYPEAGGWRNVVEYNRPADPIPYADAAEFSRVNQDCCALASRPGSGQSPPLWSRVTGRTSDFVRVRYQVRFFEASGVPGSQDTVKWVAISNCGRPGPVF